MHTLNTTTNQQGKHTGIKHQSVMSTTDYWSGKKIIRKNLEAREILKQSILDARAIKNISLVFLSIKFSHKISLLAIIKPNTFLALNCGSFLLKLPKQSWLAQKICTFVITKAYIEILFFEVYIGGKGMPTS
ncbi:hypothetical protein ACJX0J_024159, partial [Zea mays]